MIKSIPLSKIKVRFGGKNIPKDVKLLEFLRMAYKGSLLVTVASIKMDAIKPYSDFMPEISEAFKKYFEDSERKGTPPPLFVYPFNDKFIMSDDYSSYYLYKDKKYSEVMCVVLGYAGGDAVLEKSEPFKLPLPNAVEI